MLKIKIEPGKPFNIFALTEGPDTDSTDHIESVKFVKLYDKSGIEFSSAKFNDVPQTDGRSPKIVIDVEVAGGVGVTLEVDTQTGHSSFTGRGIVSQPGWTAELEVVRGNYNRRPPMTEEVRSVESVERLPSGQLNVNVGERLGEIMQLSRGDEPRLTYYKDGFVAFPAEWNGIPPVELSAWAVKRDVEFLREYVNRLGAPVDVAKSEWILSCDSSFINEWLSFEHGVNTGLSLEDFVKLGQDHFSFRRRAGLESNPDQRHLITYDTIVQWNADASGLEVVLYERTKWSGEQRLANGRSIGIGGHIEKSDALYIDFDPDRPDILNTITAGILRERMEELELISREGLSISTDVKQQLLSQTSFTGFLTDNEDPKHTGDYHIGLCSVCLLPKGVRAETRGKSDLFVGCMPLADALRDPILERWSTLIAQHLLRIEPNFTQVPQMQLVEYPHPGA